MAQEYGFKFLKRNQTEIKIKFKERILVFKLKQRIAFSR